MTVQFEYLHLGIEEGDEPSVILENEAEILKNPTPAITWFPKGTNFGDALDQLGKHGWELCSSASIHHYSAHNGNLHEYLFILKRKLTPKTD